VSQAAAGLAAAHEVGVIHRDVNPRNIMITSKGQVKIMDFGLAVSAEMTKLTQPGHTAGTAPYMSPEQARGIGVDHRTDIWALGIVLHEITTGHRVFKGDSDQAVIYSILNEDPPLPSRLRPELPAGLDAVVAKAIAKRMEDRYQSMEELLEDLEALVQGGEVTATIPARVRHHGTSRFARQWAPWLGLVAIAALVAVVVRMLLPTGAAVEELTQQRVLVAPFENRTGDPSLDHIGERVAGSVSEGLAREDLAEVVTHAAEEGAGGQSLSISGLLGVARHAGASILVAGSYDVLSDSLHIETRLLDVSDGKVLNLIPHESGPLATPAAAIAKTRSRVMGALAARADPSIMRDALAHAPTWEAYQQYAARLEAAGVDAALEHLARAAELDPAFTAVRLPQTEILMSGMYLAEADSLVREVLSRPRYLTPHTKLAVEAAAARKRGDYAEELRKFRELIPVEPQLPWLLAYLTSSAMRLNRVHEVIEMCEPLLEQARERDGHAEMWVYFRLSEAYHRVGEFERQLEIVREAIEAYPDALGFRSAEVCALAGLGRAEEIHRIVEEAASTPVGGEAEMPGWSQYPAFDLMLTAVEELKAHGYTEDGAGVAEDLLEWQERRATSEGDTLESRYWLALALKLAGRWEEALAIMEELERVGYDARLPTLDDINYQGFIGVLAARSGDRERALEIKSALLTHDEPYKSGHDSVYATQWAACIACLLGEREEAMELLNAAMACGSDFWWYLHRDPDLEPMRDYPPFRRLLEPRG
jgi:tetratricopeptide (TPR) repeat protein